jgi:dTDP-4-amino-4,6-dideoxygalactose transaminase
MTIPFLNLKLQYINHREELDNAMQDVLDNAAFIGGETLTDFEHEFAKELGVKHCVGVGNGTDALYIAMKMLGIGPDDEVITASNTWISSSESISQTGAQVVFADVEPEHFTIDPACIERKITPRTKAIVPVHFHGNVADMEAIGALCQKYGLLMVEDCAQAHFAHFKGRNVGTFGHSAAFSFYPGKNLGAYGDGGAVVTNDDLLAEKILRFARHGALNKYDHTFEGINSRLDALQAAVLRVKLKHIHEWTEARRRNAALYNELLCDVPQVQIPSEREGGRHVYHLYVIRCLENRDGLMASLQSQGIACMLHYPVILPLLEAYSYLGHRPQDFPVAYSHQHQILSLPMFPELRENEIRYVCSTIRAFYGY